jgi:hypothetical protein
MPMWKPAENGLSYDASAVKHPDGLRNPKTTHDIAALRWEHGYSAASYDVSPAKRLKTLRPKCGHSYDLKIIRNIQPRKVR